MDILEPIVSDFNNDAHLPKVSALEPTLKDELILTTFLKLRQLPNMTRAYNDVISWPLGVTQTDACKLAVEPHRKTDLMDSELLTRCFSATDKRYLPLANLPKVDAALPIRVMLLAESKLPKLKASMRETDELHCTCPTIDAT
jgi:hypothetical protein